MKSTKNFNPGHYIQFKGSGFTLDSIKGRAINFRGILLELPWKDVEPTEGEYNFTLIETYLDWCKTNSKQLILMFLDRDFKKGSNILPKWLVQKGLTTKFNGEGTIAKIWIKDVTDLRSSVLSAIYETYTGNTILESIILQETALGGIMPSNTQGFTYSGYTAQIITLIESLKDVSNNIQLWQSINWLGGFETPYLSMIAQAIKDTSIGGLTNPDSVPWQETEKPMYKIMSQFSNDISIAFGGDASQLEKPGEYYQDFKELVDLQYDMAYRHNAHYQIWNSSFDSKQLSGKEPSTQYLAAINNIVGQKYTNQSIPLTLLKESTLQERIKDWYIRLGNLYDEGKDLIDLIE